MAINNMKSNLVFLVKGEMAFVNSQESTPREKDKRQIEDQSEGNSSKQTIRTAVQQMQNCYTPYALYHTPCVMLYCPQALCHAILSTLCHAILSTGLVSCCRPCVMLYCPPCVMLYCPQALCHAVGLVSCYTVHLVSCYTVHRPCVML